jgi:hypothetical protein
MRKPSSDTGRWRNWEDCGSAAFTEVKRKHFLKSPSKSRMPKCKEYEKLESEVSSILKELVQLTTQQLGAFQANNHALFMRLDRQLELTVGAKERSVGALRQHVKDHRCLSG